jgi:hypothetical protein
MSNRHTHLTPRHVAPASRLAARPLNLCTSPAEARNPAATDEVEQAKQLIADLLALVDAKLIEPITNPGGPTRYAPGSDDASPASWPPRRPHRSAGLCGS